jgi:hypothetical protein
MKFKNHIRAIIYLSLLLLSTNCNSDLIKNDTIISDTKTSDDSLQFIPIQIPDEQLTPSEVSNYVNMLSNYRFVMGKNLDASNLAEKLSEKIATTVSNNGTYNLDTLLTKTAELKELNMKCFTFGYDCGGTQGFINYPILTWVDKNNQLKAFNFSKYRTCVFTEIHKLNNNLFLLIGDAKGSGACHQNIAYVVEIKDSELNAEYKAFVNRPYLNFCNTDFKYDSKRQVLYTIPYEGHGNIAKNLNDIFMYRQFSKDSIANQKLYDMISEEYYSKGSIHLKFKNGKFEGF